ncbi:hypothetical protein GCM10023083_59540 [Streptomyces phyllanthi]
MVVEAVPLAPQIGDVRGCALEQSDLTAPGEHGQSRIEVRSRADVNTENRPFEVLTEMVAEVVTDPLEDLGIGIQKITVIMIDVRARIKSSPGGVCVERRGAALRGSQVHWLKIATPRTTRIPLAVIRTVPGHTGDAPAKGFLVLNRT